MHHSVGAVGAAQEAGPFGELLQWLRAEIAAAQLWVNFAEAPRAVAIHAAHGRTCNSQHMGSGHSMACSTWG